MKGCNRFKVFAVEDRESDVTLLKTAVTRCAPEVEVTAFGTVKELLDAVGDQNKALPDLFVLDINLPDGDGFETLRVLREKNHTRNIPAVILTTSGSSVDIRRGFQERASSYFVKPLEVKEFFEMIDSILKYWRFASPYPAS